MTTDNTYWAVRRPLHRAWEFVIDLPWRLRNLRLFFSAAWYFNSCDWSPSFRLLRVALLANATCFDHGHAVGSGRAARECRIAAELLRRLIDDADDETGTDKNGEYYFWTLDLSRKIYVKDRKRTLPLGFVRSAEYQEMLGNLIGRKLATWWD